MNAIEERLNGEEKLEDVRKGLVLLMNGAIEVVEEVASPENMGDKLHNAVKNYLQIRQLSGYFLSEQQLNELDSRYNQIRKRWILT